MKRNRNNAAGAALATMCTLSEYLTEEDYMEMYYTISPHWQKSTYGKMILKEAQNVYSSQ